MEIAHTINLTGANVDLENVDLSDNERRNSLIEKTPTTTLPFLETAEGNLSESKAIDYYLCLQYKPELLGNTLFEKAKVNQWIEFACNEINRSARSIIYPIFGWAPYCKESADKENGNIKKYLNIIETNLKDNNTNYIVGNKMTLADVALYRYLRPFMMLHFPEGMRNKVFPLTTKWFENVMNSPEAVKAYGRTVLCKNPVKAFTGEVSKNNKPEEKKECDKKNESNNQKKEKGNHKENHNENQKENHNENQKENQKEKHKENHKENNKENQKENKNENKKGNKKDKNEKAKALKSAPIVKQIEKKPYVPSMLELPRFYVKKKENNPLDALPPSKFNLENFKNDFINHSNKADAMEDFWKNYDPSGYSIWHIEYNNEPNEFITLFRTVIKKGDILLQLKYFKPYCFGVLGVYGSDGDYKISGCMVWRGQEIPEEMKDVVCFKKLKFRKLNENEKSDKDLVFDYWTKIDEKESVCGRLAIDTRYFY